jgi:glycosyltransferase involved in cell wall biosynthesis
MRIAYLLYDFDFGGMVTWVYNLATRLHAQHELHFVCTHVDRIADKFRDVGRATFLGQDWPAVQAYLRAQRIDVVQYGQTRIFGDCALAAGVPVVIERMDGLRGAAARLPKWGLDAVIASTQQVVPVAAEQIDPTRIHLIYNGVDPARYQGAARRRPGCADGDVVIGAVCRFGRGKNLELLIDAVVRLLPRYPRIRLMLVGGRSHMPGAEDYEPILRQRAAHLGDRVVFTGQADDPAGLIAGFDIGVCVSREGVEGIPNALMESMASGTPVVATAVGGIAELIRHGQDGLLIRDSDLDGLVAALAQLLDAPAQRAAMGRSGAQRIEEHFNLDRQAQRYAELYASLVDQRRTRRGPSPGVARRQRARLALLTQPARKAVASALRQAKAQVVSR